MNKPLTLIVLFITTLIIAGTVGIAASTADTGSGSSASAGVDTASAETPENTAQIDAYLASLEQQRQLDEFLQGLNKKVEEEKAATAAAAAKQAVTSTRQTAPPSDGWASADGLGRWDQLAQCETGGNWATNTGNGFGGGLQFMHGSGYSTWLSFGGGEFAQNPWDASREQQIIVAEKVLAISGWGAWPGCSRKYGWL